MSCDFLTDTVSARVFARLSEARDLGDRWNRWQGAQRSEFEVGIGGIDYREAIGFDDASATIEKHQLDLGVSVGADDRSLQHAIEKLEAFP